MKEIQFSEWARMLGIAMYCGAILVGFLAVCTWMLIGLASKSNEKEDEVMNQNIESDERN